MTRRNQIFTACLIFFFSTTSAQRDGVNPMLLNDLDLNGPGVLARLTPTGTSYVSAVVAKALAMELPITKTPNDVTSTKLTSLPSVTLSNLRLNVFNLPSQFNVNPVAPNLVTVELRNMDLSIGAFGTGNVDGVAMNTPMEIRTNRFTLEVHIRLGRNARGNPHLKIDHCQVPAKMPVTVAVQNPLTPASGSKFAQAIALDGHTVFEQIVCPKLIHIVENRINQRFSLLATKITLGDTNNFDLVRSLSIADNGLRRSADQPVPSKKPVAVAHRAPKVVNKARNVVHRQAAAKRYVPPGMVNRVVLHDRQVAMRAQRRRAASEPINVRSPIVIRARRQANDQFHTFLNQFNLSRADNLILDYGMIAPPVVSARGIEIATQGEITVSAMKTPFGPRHIAFPPAPSDAMLQVVVADYVPNTLMYHGHRIGLFNTRVDPKTPQFGPVMRTTCDLSTGSLFCVGDLFPTLREMVPDRGVAFLFSTLKAPAVAVRPESMGGIKFSLEGLIEILAINGPTESRVGQMEIHIEATMKMRLSSKAVRGRVNLDNIKLTTRTPRVLVQDELDDAGFLSREILQRMVNDILKQGIPIPVHPLFKLQKPKLTLLDRSMLLETNFQLNEKLIRQLTSEHLA